MRKNMKAFVAGLVALTLALPTLSGCAKKAEAPAEPAPASEAAEPVQEAAAPEPTEVEEETETEVIEETETEPAEEADPLYAEMADWMFAFTSGAGAWSTTIEVEPDGSFVGLYEDANMGETGDDYPNGTVYESKFSGQFTDYTKISPCVYEVNFGELNYEKEPETEEVVDETLYKYSPAYGLQNTNSLIVYLPGTPYVELPEEYLDWVSFMNFTAYVDEEVYEDTPKWLPFCGLYNSTEEEGFFSTPLTKDNKYFLVNKATFPGFTNESLEYSEDGTYRSEDVSDDGFVRIINLCFKDDGAHSLYDDEDAFAEYCIENLLGVDAIEEDNLYVQGSDDLEYGAGRDIYIDGQQGLEVSWTGDDPDTYWTAKVMQKRNYDMDTAYDYVYAICRNTDAFMTGEAANFLLRSLTFSGVPDHLSSESKDRAEQCITAMVLPGPGTTILADETLQVSADDTELLEEYGVDEDDITNDYALVGNDGSYDEYALADNCPIYLQYPHDYFMAPIPLDRYTAEVGTEDPRFMVLYLDADERVIFAYEPYRP